MKRFILICLIFLTSFVKGAGPVTPHIKTEKSNIKGDGISIEKTDRRIYLENNCVLNLTTHNEENKNLLLKRKWGDFLFGLSMGKIWNGWNFIDVSVKTPMAKISPISTFLPSSIFLIPVGNAWLAEIRWPLRKNGNAFLKMDIFQFPSHKNWLFFRLELVGDGEIESISLPCYPATSHWAENAPSRERILATVENIYNLSRGNYEFAPQSPGMILYNKYMHENDGCMIIIDDISVKKIVLPETKNAITSSIFLNQGAATMCFALGFFTDSPAEKETVMFLGETQYAIAFFMKEINWSPEINSNDAEKISEDLKKILNDAGKMGLPVDPHLVKSAEDLQSKIIQAKANADLVSRGELLQELEALRNKIIRSLLDNYK